jgi:deferrochelatase/peroxidase EfeB
MRTTRDSLVLRWTVSGYSRGSHPVAGHGAPRNLMGFKDGTSNLDTADEAATRRFVWVGDGDGEPAWAAGGSYLVLRQIRMFVEFWDRTPLNEQERIMGRRKASGAPLDGEREADVPGFAADPSDTVTPADAHIRLANPRTGTDADHLILRRGFSYVREADRAGQLDQGLAFVSYQRSLERGFVAVQQRLDGEPLEEYIKPEGGGYFFALPGVRSGTFLGEGLVG